MSKRLMSRLLGMFQSRTQVGVDKAGNRYFTRVEESDGASSYPHPLTAFYLLTRPSNYPSALDLLWKEDGTWMLANKQILRRKKGCLSLVLETSFFPSYSSHRRFSFSPCQSTAPLSSGVPQGGGEGRGALYSCRRRSFSFF
jgi:hypothetical protein